MSRARRIALIGLSFLILGALSAAGTLSAETVLVAVRETVDGAPSDPPLPAVDGVSSGLFAAGHIVFDAGSRGSSGIGDLVEVAREGGAGWLLDVSVAYKQTKLDQGAVRVAGSASFSLVNALTGVTSLSDRVAGSNAGREKKIDLTALGVELGRLISQRVTRALPTPSL
ncbi:MAG TPA: hypothetical protein VMU36_13175 [Spirochaetia bacterium]|nr:hypothetical protein [Spirochaetia bacterium]